MREKFEKIKEFLIYFGLFVFLLLIWLYVVFSIAVRGGGQEKNCVPIGPLEEIHCRSLKE